VIENGEREGVTRLDGRRESKGGNLEGERRN